LADIRDVEIEGLRDGGTQGGVRRDKARLEEEELEEEEEEKEEEEEESNPFSLLNVFVRDCNFNFILRGRKKDEGH